MSSSGKKNKKKKWQSVAVETILPNAVVRPTTSWAEEVESELLSEYSIKKFSNISLPTAPRAACDLIIDDSKIPPNGPFMAYLSNLPYEITEDDLVMHFKDLKIANIQLPKDDRQDRMKGFGYVEFKDKSNLIAALQEGELTLKGRYVRISLPNDEEPSRDRGMRSGGMSFGRNRDSDRNDRSDRPLGEWRAAVPVPHDPDKSTSSRNSVGFTRPSNREGGGGFREGGGGFREGGGGFRERDRDREGGGFRDFRSNFQPADSGPTFSRRDDRDRGGDRDRDSDRGGGNRMFKRFDREDRMGSGRDRDDRMGRSAFGGRKFDREDREMRRDPVPEREEPKQRPKLEIQPRSIPLDVNRAPESLPASIFGGAKPVDTAKREMEIEAKLVQSSAPQHKSRGESPPRSTPTSNRSRSSSVSSNCRRQDNDSAETANNSSKSPVPLDNERNESAEGAKDEQDKPKPQEFKQPENVWKRRSLALAAASGESNGSPSSTVIENSEAVDTAESAAENSSPAENRPVDSANEDAEDTCKSDENSVKSDSKSDVKVDDPNQWTTYSPASFDSQQSGGGRYGGGGGAGGQYNDKFSSFNRDNRKDRMRERENSSRDGERRSYFKNRDDRNESSAFGGKWNHNRDRDRDRDRDGAFKSRSGEYGGSRRQDRDNSGSYNNFRDRHDGKSSSKYSAFGTNRRNDNESRSRYEDRNHDRRHEDERLIDSEQPTTNTNVKSHSEGPDSRLKVVNSDSAKPLENGTDNGVVADEAIGSSENISNDQSELNDESFKTRKKQKKKSKTLEKNDEVEKEVKPSENDRKAKNQKDEKNIDNHQNNDKVSNKNNSKGKDNPKTPKKSRDQTGDILPMPKQKEEKAPNFQDKNLFQFLDVDD